MTRDLEAKEKMGIAQIKEKVDLSVLEALANGNGKINSTTLLEDALRNNMGQQEYDLTGNSTSGWQLTVGEKTYGIDMYGTVTEENEAVISKKIVLSTSQLNLSIESETEMPTGTITATLVNITGTVSWTSSNKNVATVDKTGEEVEVTAAGEGEATITATCGDSTATCKVIVRKQTVDDIAKVDYYGKYIDYDVDVDGNTTDNDWKIFYNDGTNIYIVTDNHIENTNENIPVDQLGFTRGTKYTLQWDSNFVKTGAIDIFGTNASNMTKYIANKYLSSWKNTMTESTWSENINAKIAAALMDTEAWSGFAESEKVKTLTSKQDELAAIGGIPIEMFIKSWNDLFGNLKIYYNSTESTGYHVGTDGEDTTSYGLVWANIISSLGYNDKLYTPHTVYDNDCWGCWLIGPSAAGVDNVVVAGMQTWRAYNGNTSQPLSVRPVVCLPSDITAEYNETKGIFEIVKK